MIAAQGSLHDIRSLETTFVFCGGNEGGLSRTDSKYTRLRRVDDGGEMGDVEHAEV